MSTKQLRRYMKAKGKLNLEKESEIFIEDNESDESDKSTHNVPNRFAFLDTTEEIAEDADDDETSEGYTKKMAAKEEKASEKIKKKRCKKKNKLELHITEDFSASKCPGEICHPSEDTKVIFEKDLFKFDLRSLDAETELRKLIGRNFSGRNLTIHQKRYAAGRIVKRKTNWPDVKRVGLSMELDKTENGLQWFKFVHGASYRELQQAFWIASSSMDHSLISDILRQCPYHLDSLLVMAEVLRLQEDFQMSRDLIERGIFCCESSFSPLFQLTTYEHRINYSDFENRAFYLLLNRHLRNLIDRCCYRSAFNMAKLLFSLDPVGDPVAIMLVIDSIALKAREYTFLIQLFDTLQVERNLDRLPSFAFSVSLALFFLSEKSGLISDRQEADKHLALAIRHFPTLLMQLLDKLNIRPDAKVENSKYMNSLAHERESEGIKMLISIYVSHSSDLWNDPNVLAWLESITSDTISSFVNFKEEMELWISRRRLLYVGIPRNIQRHAWLWDIIRGDESTLTDPYPPATSRVSYVRDSLPANSDSFFTGLLHSLLPEFNQAQPLSETVEDVLNAIRRMFVNNENDDATEEPEVQEE